MEARHTTRRYRSYRMEMLVRIRQYLQSSKCFCIKYLITCLIIYYYYNLN